MVKVNFVYEVMGNGWGPLWVKNVVDALQREGIGVHEIDVTAISFQKTDPADDRRAFLAGEPACDVWFSQAFVPWVLPEVLERAEREGTPVVASYHGGVPHRSLAILKDFATGQDEELRVMAAQLSRLFVNLPHNVEVVSRHYGLPASKVVPIGYPISSEFSPSTPKGRTIVVPGRLHEEKGTYLAAHILEPFMEDVVFCTPMADEEYERALRTWGYRVEVLDQLEYHRFLETCEIAFTASMSESCSVAMVESHFAGCKVITPAMQFFGHFQGKLQYEPYSIASAHAKIYEARQRELPVDHDMRWYSPHLFGKRLASVLREVVNG